MWIELLITMIFISFLYVVVRKVGRLNVYMGKLTRDISIIKEVLRRTPETKDVMEKLDEIKHPE